MFQEKSNFIKTIIKRDLEKNKYQSVVTRFPPEPNGFLHLGHARAIIVNFELSKFFKGKTYLRYDDTNPRSEKKIYVDSILEDIHWLGYQPDKVFFSSDYFEEIFQKAVLLIKKGKAFVDDLNSEQIKNTRGDFQNAGLDSPYRNRSIETNLLLFYQMKEGLFQEGEKVLRAKINMDNPNMNLRDPVLYRILDAYTLKNKHYFIFPSYDFAHPLGDSIEGITHSLCSLEFEDHRPLYDWVIRETEMQNIPTQIEFGRLNVSQIVLSKRHLKTLIEHDLVSGWDDPRIPTLKGMRRKGYTPESIKKFVLESGLSRNNTFVDFKMLENSIRNELQYKVKKVMVVTDPLKVTILNYPENKREFTEVPYDDCLKELGTRKVFFSKYLYIEKDDFQIEKKDPSSKKLFLNGEVRLFHFYFIKAVDVIRNNEGEIIEILAFYDPETKSGTGFNKRKPNGTIHFIEQMNVQKVFINFFQPLFKTSYPKNIIDEFNFDSFQQKEAFIEGSLYFNSNYEKFQFLRKGYFILDLEQQKNSIINFNEIVSLRNLYNTKKSSM
ncbi:glutamine--tRNA ligase [Candidatus Phytoplasma pini]|uniref:Glutamine--tRNA ligase n=1 Tax=Candidatus Phytoplasma pini TaxID=267362 RepID=A0A559KJX7_9MOLU|nr:glutamine--tRNA ligase [Candidatus Phytoplasma pini]TVY12435.1 Glutamine tRNA ligase [Candidatus Phytoplasma pini]